MNSLAKNSQKLPFDPLLEAWKSLFFENISRMVVANKDTASHTIEFCILTDFSITTLMSYNYHYTTHCVIVFRPIRIDSEIVLHQPQIFPQEEDHS